MSGYVTSNDKKDRFSIEVDNDFKENDPIHFYDNFIIPFVILIPLSFEMRFFSLNYIGGALKSDNKIIIIKNVVYYIKRIAHFYYVFFRRLGGFKFSKNFIKCD